MKKRIKQLMTVLLSIAVMLSFSSMTAFAYTALDDDGARASVTEGTCGVVATNSGMLRTQDEGTSVALSSDMKSLDVTVKSTNTKTWGKVTKVALIEGTATDEEKNAAAQNVIMDDNTYSEDAASKVFHYSIPLNEIGKKVPVCVYQGEEGSGKWITYNEQSYYVVLYTMDLLNMLKEANAASPSDELAAAVAAAESALEIKDLTLEKLNGVMMTINSATLYKENGAYKVDLVIKGTSYTKVFAGYASQANQDDTGAIPIVNDSENSVSYVTLPVELNVPTVFAFKGSKYYNRTLTVTEDKLSYDNTSISLEQFDNMTLEEAIARAELDTSVATVNALIAAIQVQKRDQNTDKYCAIAKAYYDALSNSDKNKLEDPGYFGDDTGDASLDDPRNQDNIGKKELLVVSFGTSFNGSRVETIKAVEDALQKAYPDYGVRRAFTAQIIINHIQSRDGEAIDNMDQALDRAVANGVKELVVQPTHLMHGYEFDEMCDALKAYQKKFDSIIISEPLLNTNADKEAVAKAVVEKAAKDAGFASVDAATADTQTAFVFMGHGTSHKENATYTYMQETMTKLGYKNCFIGTVEGEPEETEVHAVLGKVQAGGYTKVVLRPLMVVAGDHANNDMAGDEEDSWKSIFGAALGADNVSCQINGLGEIAVVQNLYVSHVKEALAAKEKADKEAEKKAAEEAAKKKDAANKAAVAKIKVTIKTPKKAKKAFTAKWKNVKNVTGYQVQYSLKKNFKGAKTKEVKGAAKKSVKINKLKKKKTYYVKVRAYKVIDGKTYYGAWSKVKKVKTK